MSKVERRHINLDDDEGDRLYAIWSRSGKRLIVTVGSQTGSGREARQMELHPAQVEQLIAWLTATVAAEADDR